MEFGLEKCAVIHMKKGKVIDSPIVKSIPFLTGDDNYKYLGILQTDKILHEEVRPEGFRKYEVVFKMSERNFEFQIKGGVQIVAVQQNGSSNKV